MEKKKLISEYRKLLAEHPELKTNLSDQERFESSVLSFGLSGEELGTGATVRGCPLGGDYDPEEADQLAHYMSNHAVPD